jgi:hypothetical protein
MIHINLKEIILLTILFTGLALYLDIHRRKLVFSFITNHCCALFIAFILSKYIYDYLS